MDADRLPYGGMWTDYVGVIGGIPDRSTVAQTLTSSATAAQINTAITNCPSGEVVLLQAGTYTAGGTITLNKSGVTLRGEVDANGVPTTILQNFTIDIAADTDWDPTNSGQWTDIAVSSGLTRGSNQLVLASAPGSITGRLIWICSQALGSTIAGTSFATMHGSYVATQVNKVTGVNGSTITLQDTISTDYWSGTNRVSFRASNKTISRSGMENLSFTTTNANGHNSRYWDFMGTDECWAKNCKTNFTNTGVSHYQLYTTYRTEIRHSEIYRIRITAGSDNSNQYACYIIQSGGFLLEDNYIHSVPNVSPIIHSNMGMFAYNYITDLPYDDSGGNTGWLSQIIFSHGGHNNFICLEGNWVAASYSDATLTGNTSHSRLTMFFRNRMRGWDTGKDDNTQAITTESHHDLYTIAGNVLGENGYHTTYLGEIIDMDATSTTTRDLFSNYNTVTDGIAVAEQLGAGEALADSYLHTSKPSWFGSLPWPWCVPTNYAQANDPESFPAGYRAANGVDPS